MRNPFRRTQKKTESIENRTSAESDVSARIEAAPGEAVEGRLLVMGRESAFSDEVVDYAIDMAKRMSFEIVALNSAPLSCDSFSLFSTSRNKLCQEFKSISEQSAQSFRQAAEEKGIRFTHVVRFDEPDQALAGVQREYGNIEFVIADAQQPATQDRVAESNRPKSEVLVYSMI